MTLDVLRFWGSLWSERPGIAVCSRLDTPGASVSTIDLQMAEGAIFQALEFREHYPYCAPYCSAECKRSEKTEGSNISALAGLGFRETPRSARAYPAPCSRVTPP
jgi:hypothetical protein